MSVSNIDTFLFFWVDLNRVLGDYNLLGRSIFTESSENCCQVMSNISLCFFGTQHRILIHNAIKGLLKSFRCWWPTTSIRRIFMLGAFEHCVGWGGGFEFELKAIYNKLLTVQKTIMQKY